MEKNREGIIVKTSIIGIAVNVLLAGFKAFVGLAAGSIAVILDAVNNLSDALSSVITIVGTKLAGKAPDRKHPLGYGRIEYLSAAIISAIVLYAGITSLTESVKKILHPSAADYSALALIIVGMAVVAKILLGLHVSKVGKKVNSDSLMASGKDALFDSIISASTLVAAFFSIMWDISLEAYLGVLISLVIIKAGFEMLSDTVSDLLGRRADDDLVKQIKSVANEVDGVLGVFDVVVSNYGPTVNIASFHIAVDSSYDAAKIDSITRKIQAREMEANGIAVSAIGIYSHNTDDEEIIAVREKISEIVRSHEGVKQIHGFYMDKDAKFISFDVVFTFDVKDRKTVFTAIKEELAEEYPDYRFNIAMDLDISD